MRKQSCVHSWLVKLNKNKEWAYNSSELWECKYCPRRKIIIKTYLANCDLLASEIWLHPLSDSRNDKKLKK